MPTPNVDQALFGQAEVSGTSHSVTTGVKTFTLDVDNGYAQTDYTVQIVSTADPDCWMYGVITSKTSPSITVNIFKVSDVVGTFDDWSIQVISGPFAGLPASQTLGFSSDTASVPAVGDVLNWTIETGKAFYDNSTVYVSAVNDRTDFFFATVVSYNSGTGAIKLAVNRASGSGSNSLWAISLVDVTAALATFVGNTDYTILPSDSVVILDAALTANRTWTLPLAASVPKGRPITILDGFGAIAQAPKLILSRAGSDSLNTASTVDLVQTNISITLVSDGVSRWNFNPQILGRFNNIEATADTLLQGTLSVAGAVQLGDSIFDTTTITGSLSVGGNFLLSGSVSYQDSTTTFYDNGDSTKKLAFQCSGISTATTRTATWPDANITVCGIATTQTLTNKTIDLASNTLTGTKAQWTTAVSDGTPAYLNSTQTWTSVQTFIDAGARIQNVGNSAFTMNLRSAGTFTANRNLNINLNDTATTLNLVGNLTVSATADVSGTNTGDQTLGSFTTGNLATSGSIKSTGTGGVGYATGAGGTVTQATSNSTAVTINKICGQITMFALIGGAGGGSANARFTVNNSTVAATDVVVLSVSSGISSGSALVLTAVNVTAGAFDIVVSNQTGTNTTNPPVINFAVIKGVAT